MASFFSDDDDEDVDINADSPNGSETAVVLATSLPSPPGSGSGDTDVNADSPDGSEAGLVVASALAATSGPPEAPEDANPPPPAAQPDPSPRLRALPSQTHLVPVKMQPGRQLTRADRKSFTFLSDDESSEEGMSCAIEEEGAGQLQELERWKERARLLEGQIEDLQERLEESEQSWSHEQHRRKSQWLDERASLESENARLQRMLIEWLPMQHEDERSLLLREVLNTVARTRQALGSQGNELVSYSEHILEENNQLEEFAQGQAKNLEEQRSEVVRLCGELDRMGREAERLREAEQQAESTALEGHVSADVLSELRCQHEALQRASAQHEFELQSQFNNAEAECEALAQSLQDESGSMRQELQAMEVLLQEKAKCHDLHHTCQRLQEELAERQGAEAQRHGHLEASCLQLEEELSECRKAELSELRRIEDVRHELEEQLAEHRHSSGAECRDLAESLRQLEEELLQCQHSERSECERREGMHQILEEARQELLDEVAESRHLEGQELRRLHGICGDLQEELRVAAEAGDTSGAEAAEAQQTIAQLSAKLAAHEAQHALASHRHSEEQWRELEERCAASEEEVQRLREQLRERDAQGPSAAEEALRRQVKDLQRHCEDLEARCLAHQAECEYLRADAERLTLQAEAAANAPPREEPHEQLHAVRSELAEAQELGRCLRQGEAAHAEHRRRAEEHAEHAQQLLQAAEQRANALDEELRRAKEPCLSPGRDPKRSLPSRHRRMVGLARGSATAVSKLLKDVIGINDVQAMLGGSGAEKRVEQLERHASCLERSNHDWASAASELPGEWQDPAVHPGALPDWCDYAADGRRKHGMSPGERRAALTTALQHMARRLESLHGRLQEFSPSEDQDDP